MPNIFNISDIQKGVDVHEHGKACVVDRLTKENITNCHPAIIVYLNLLFNIIYLHGFVHDDLIKWQKYYHTSSRR